MTPELPDYDARILRAMHGQRVQAGMAETLKCFTRRVYSRQVRKAGRLVTEVIYDLGKGVELGGYTAVLDRTVVSVFTVYDCSVRVL